MTHSFISIPEAIQRLKTGQMIILIDDEQRENEGDLVVAAEYATPEVINFMAGFARGLICLSLDETIVSRLQLPMMVSNNKSRFGTAFTVSIEAARGGINGYFCP